MKSCKRVRAVEQWFDQGMPGDAEEAQHIESCGVCAGHVAQLAAIREGVRGIARDETIADGQLPAFMAGIREGVEAQAVPWWRPARLWALSSVATAALIASTSLFMVFSGEPAEVEGSIVESYSTDLEDADVSYYSSENGTKTVWVNVAREDLW